MASAIQDYSNADGEWSEMALVAMAGPSENTRLYIAKAAIERGAEQRWTGSVWVTGNNDALSRYLGSPALSLPVAHLTDNWRITLTPDASEPLGRITTVPSSYLAACTRSSFADYTWASEAALPDGGLCSRMYYRYHCTTRLSDPCAEDATPAECYDKRCTFFAETGECSRHSYIPMSTHTLCDMCDVCYAPGSSYALVDPMPWADDWMRLPNASTDVADWGPRCVSVCAERTPLHMLHYVQVDIDNDVCDCWASTTTPEPPDNAAVSHWVSHNGGHVVGGNVHVYSVGPPAWGSTFLQAQGGTLYHAGAFSAGATMRGDQLDSLPGAWSSLDACAEGCVVAFGGAHVAGLSYDATQSACACTTRDPLALHNRAIVVAAPATTQLYAAYWCQHVRPDSNDGAYVYHNDTGTWCPGRVATRMGEAVLGGEVHQQHEDVALASALATRRRRARLPRPRPRDVVGAPVLHPRCRRCRRRRRQARRRRTRRCRPTTRSPRTASAPLLVADGDGEDDVDPDANGDYSMMRGAPDSCASEAPPVFTGEYLSVLQLARELRQRRALTAASARGSAGRRSSTRRSTSLTPTPCSRASASPGCASATCRAPTSTTSRPPASRRSRRPTSSSR